MTFRIAVLDDYTADAQRLAEWSSLGDGVETVFFHDHVVNDDQLVQRLRPFDAIVAMRERTKFPRHILEALPKLKLLVSVGMTNAAIDIDAAERLGVVVSGTHAEENLAGTVELSWGLVLAVCRRIASGDAAIRAGGWQVELGTVLAGKTFGIVGLGRVGSLMVPIARAFGMDVAAWSRNLDDATCERAGVRRLSRQEFFETCDVISVHVKMGPGSAGYISERDLRAMKPSAILVNTSRGEVVEEAAIVRAIRERWISGAALDVYCSEPLGRQDALRSLPNTVVTPHIGFCSEDAFKVHYAMAIENIAAFRLGHPTRILSKPRPAAN